MKRSWIGLGILLCLLAAGLGVTCAMGHNQRPMVAHLEQAALFGGEADWDKALPHAQAAECAWQCSRPWIACVADHTPMEEMDQLFAQLTCYAAARETTQFAATCRSLTQMAQALADAQTLPWWAVL